MKSILALCTTIVITVLSCSNFLDSGTGSTTETSLVAGMLYEPDGTTPADSAKVYIRKKSSYANIAGSGASAIDSTLTDNRGKFFFDSTLQAGIYTIEAVKGANAAVINPVNVTHSPLTLSPETLEPAGAISGIVDLIGGWESGKVFVLVSGVNRFTQVAQDGSFSLPMLAEGTYDIRILATINGYDIFDTSGVGVLSATTTELDTIHLPYNGIPVPKVTITQDSIKKLVTVSWRSDASSRVKSYNVYRIEIGPDSLSRYLNAPFAANQNIGELSTDAFWQLNTTPITDTFYVDSTTLSFHKYLYRVTALDSNVNEGNAATSEIAEIKCAFKLIKTINPDEPDDLSTTGASIALINNEYILSYNFRQKKVTKYAIDGSFILNWIPTQLDVSYIGIAADGQGYSYFYCFGSIQKYDPMGNYALSIDTADIPTDSRTKYITGLCADESGNIYCCCKYQLEGQEGFIAHFSPDGVFQKSWNIQISTLRWGIKVKNGILYYVDKAATWNQVNMKNDIDVYHYDTSGTLLKTITLNISGERRMVHISYMDVDDDGNVYLFDINNNSILILNPQMQLISRFNSPFPANYANIQITGGAVARDGSIILGESIESGILIFKQQ